MNTQMGLLTKKLGMTEYYNEAGDRIPVTVLLAKGNIVLGHRTKERDGYTAIQVAFDDQKPSRLSKPKLGQFKKVEGVVSPIRVDEPFIWLLHKLGFIEGSDGP